MKSPEDASRKMEGARCSTAMAILETNIHVCYCYTLCCVFVAIDVYIKFVVNLWLEITESSL